MKSIILSIIFLINLIFLGCSDNNNLISLFNGEDFTGWTFDVLDGSLPENIWRIEDGKIIANGKGKSTSVIRTEVSYSNYEFTFEWRWPNEPGNSGCLIHCSDPRFRNVWPKSLEVQLHNGDAGDFIYLGETIEANENQKVKDADSSSWQVRRRLNLTDDSEKDSGEWNQMLIIAKNHTVEVYVNKELVNRGWNGSANRGAICLQSERADIEFRNLNLKLIEK